MIDRILYLTNKEWMIVLSKAGISGIVGFEDISFEEIKDSDLLEAIFSLTAKGLIKRNGNEFVVSEELKKYIEHLRSTRFVASERKKIDMYPISCIYFGDKDALKVEMDIGSKRRISLRFCTVDALINEAMDYSFMPQKAYELPEAYENYSADVGYWEKSFSKDESILFQLYVYEARNMDIKYKIYVKSENICDIILTEFADGEQEIRGFSRKALSDCFMRQMETNI